MHGTVRGKVWKKTHPTLSRNTTSSCFQCIWPDPETTSGPCTLHTSSTAVLSVQPSDTACCTGFPHTTTKLRSRQLLSVLYLRGVSAFHLAVVYLTRRCASCCAQHLVTWQDRQLHTTKGWNTTNLAQDAARNTTKQAAVSGKSSLDAHCWIV